MIPYRPNWLPGLLDGILGQDSIDGRTRDTEGRCNREGQRNQGTQIKSGRTGINNSLLYGKGPDYGLVDFTPWQYPYGWAMQG
jgi:hypothetical protein